MPSTSNIDMSPSDVVRDSVLLMAKAFPVICEWNPNRNWKVSFAAHLRKTKEAA